MTISNVQNWTTGDTGSASSLGMVFGSVPLAASLAICYGNCSNTVTLSVADSFGDGNSWNSLSFNPVADANDGARLYLFWKQVGTPSGGGKTITITPSANSPMGGAISEFKSSGAPTWALDGTPTKTENQSSANPSPGAITTTVDGSLVIGVVVDSTSTITAGSGFTKQATLVPRFNNSCVEDQITGTAGSYNPNWTIASGAWSAFGAAWKEGLVSATDIIPLSVNLNPLGINSYGLRV